MRHSDSPRPPDIYWAVGLPSRGTRSERGYQSLYPLFGCRRKRLPLASASKGSVQSLVSSRLAASFLKTSRPQGVRLGLQRRFRATEARTRLYRQRRSPRSFLVSPRLASLPPCTRAAC